MLNVQCSGGQRLRGSRILILIGPPPHHGAGRRVQGGDRLFFVKDGQLDAVGTYEELLEASGAFQAMAAA